MNELTATPYNSMPDTASSWLQPELTPVMRSLNAVHIGAGAAGTGRIGQHLALTSASLRLGIAGRTQTSSACRGGKGGARASHGRGKGEARVRHGRGEGEARARRG